MVHRAGDVPDDVYIQFVRSLFERRHTLLVGALCHMLVALMAYEQTGHPLYGLFAAVLVAIGFWRFTGLRRSRKELDELDLETARKWEFDYVLKGSLQGLLLGGFAFTSIYIYPHPFAELGALAINMGSLVTVVARNYGSPRMVMLFATTMIGPIALGLFLRGDIAHVVLGLLIMPFIAIINGSAADVRRILFSAVLDRKRARQLAQRFDRALNTMSHGLVMFSPEGCVVVANAQAAETLRFRSSEQLLGRTLKALLLRAVAGKLLTFGDYQFAEAQLTRALKEGRGRKVLLKLTDGRYYEFSAREGKDELGVLTFDEVTQRVAAETKIRYMARFDSLTNLPNRAYFHEMITELMQSGDPGRLCGTAILDLDDFKSINDTLGHPVGDGLIYSVAERLSSLVNDNVKISRFGGDEFMIFFNRVEDEEDFRSQLEAIISQLQGEVDVAGHALRVQVSGGGVVVPVRGHDMDSITVKADLALYSAKEQGKNGWRLFEAEMDAAFRNRQVMKADLRSAIQAKALRVVYQPIVDMQSMRITSCEALCRWDHPELGPVSPSVFIPLAEEMGLVSEISALVLDAACQECMNWPDHLSVSVNLSAKDFHSRAVVDKVRGALAKSGLQPHRLEVEVTETALLDDRPSNRSHIEALKQLGIRIALDDFGTGYSSLSYLHTLPLDRVKIDGSFLHDITANMRSRQLLKGVVELSRNLGLGVTVEGVETFEQLKLLGEAIRPDRVQGFLFGAALSSSGIETMSNTVWSVDDSFQVRRISAQH
ncbi:EAL domain-containing protein [Chelativorans sp. Marseille-P2723]|uniref:putative bifunctional diguanylate cyclase/phosphodiesterase n=1 Tax=Chelativorans sp. Marseille-P2723 TaxID=2709133 RepID=UPI00156FCED6|nr:EAL domain-containing protein [Chelativorans sp. Marseille-P2723]